KNANAVKELAERAWRRGEDSYLHLREAGGAGARPIGHARVRRAIGQALHRLVPAKAEIFRGRLADGPAAMPLLQLGKRAAIGAVRRRLCKVRQRLRPQRQQGPMLCGVSWARNVASPRPLPLPGGHAPEARE